MSDDQKRVDRKNILLLSGAIITLLLVGYALRGPVSGRDLKTPSRFEAQTKAELQMLHASILSYQARFGRYPFRSTSGTLDFIEQLSKVPINDPNLTGKKREMFAEFRTSGMKLSTDKYDLTKNPPQTTALDPFDNPYRYVYDEGSSTFYLYSYGLDEVDETDDDIRSDKLQ